MKQLNKIFSLLFTTWKKSRKFNFVIVCHLKIRVVWEDLSYEISWFNFTWADRKFAGSDVQHSFFTFLHKKNPNLIRILRIGWKIYSTQHMFSRWNDLKIEHAPLSFKLRRQNCKVFRWLRTVRSFLNERKREKLENSFGESAYFGIYCIYIFDTH